MLLQTTARIFEFYFSKGGESILALKLQCFVTMPQYTDTSEDFTQICTKQKLNASTKTCFIHWMDKSVGFAASNKAYNFMHRSHRT